MMGFVTEKVGNIVKKNDGHQHVSLFPTVYSNAFFPKCIKAVLFKTFFLTKSVTEVKELMSNEQF